MEQYAYGNTSISKADFDQLIEEMKIGKTKEWSVIKESNDGFLKVYRKMHPQYFIFKASMILNFKIPSTLEDASLYNSVLVYLLSCNYEIRSKWDPVYLQVKIVEHLQTVPSENDLETVVDVVYTKLSTPPTISYRDSCLLRVTRKQIHKPQYLVVMKTTSHKDCPIGNNVVRATSPFHGYLIEQISDTQCKLFVYSIHDFGGSIPKSIVNMVAKQAPAKWYHQLQQQVHLLEKQWGKWIDADDEKKKKKTWKEMEQFLSQHLLLQFKSKL